MVWKKPLRPKIKRARSSLRRITLLRYSIAPPPANFAPTKHAWRVRIKRGKRFVKTPKFYSIAGPPAGFLPVRRKFQIKIKRVRRFIRFPRLYSIAGPPIGFVPAKRMWRVRIKRGRRFVLPHRYPNMDPPAGFAPFVLGRVLQLHSRPMARFFRPRRLAVILPGPLVLFRKPPRLRIKRGRKFVLPRRYSIAGPPTGFIATPFRRRLRLHSRPLVRFFRPRVRGVIIPPVPLLFSPRRRLRLKRRVLQAMRRRYPVMVAPVGFVAFKKPPRAKIRRARIRIRPRPYPILPALLLLFRKLPRLKIKRGRRFIRFPRLYSISGPPASFVAFKKPPRAKVKRWRSSLRPFTKRLYSIAGPPDGFVPFVLGRILQLNSRPLKAFFRSLRLRYYAFPSLPPPPIVVPPPPGGGKRKKTAKQLEQERRNAALVEKAKQALSPGDQARAKIARKLRKAVKSEGLIITHEEMLLLLHALEDDDDED